MPKDDIPLRTFTLNEERGTMLSLSSRRPGPAAPVVNPKPAKGHVSEVQLAKERRERVERAMKPTTDAHNSNK